MEYVCVAFGFALNSAIAEYVIESNGRVDAQAVLVPPTLPSTATGSTVRRPQAQQIRRVILVILAVPAGASPWLLL